MPSKNNRYTRVITPSGKRSLKRLSSDAQQELLHATKILIHNPLAGEKLHGSLSFLFSFHWKFQNVHYRVAYSVDSERRLIIIHLVGPRENFYERLRRLL